jgi:hypothetical protein
MPVAVAAAMAAAAGRRECQALDGPAALSNPLHMLAAASGMVSGAGGRGGSSSGAQGLAGLPGQLGPGALGAGAQDVAYRQGSVTISTDMRGAQSGWRSGPGAAALLLRLARLQPPGCERKRARRCCMPVQRWRAQHADASPARATARVEGSVQPPSPAVCTGPAGSPSPHPAAC